MPRVSQIYYNGGQTLNASRQGEEDGMADARRNRLTRVGQIAATGDYDAASKAALEGADFDVASPLMNIVTSSRNAEIAQVDKANELKIKQQLADAATTRAANSGKNNGRFIKFNAQGGVESIADGVDPASIPAGVSQPTTGQTSQIQGDVVGLQQMNRQLDSIAKMIKPAYFTYGGEAVQAAAHYGDKLKGIPYVGKLVEPSKEMREFGAQRKAAMAQIRRHFNLYRKEITGAAAAVAELSQLMDAMINPNLSYPEFQQVFANYRQELNAVLKAKEQVLSQGIPIGDPKFGPAVDNAWAEAQGPSQGKSAMPAGTVSGSIDERGDELMADLARSQGYSSWAMVPDELKPDLAAQVAQQLLGEGYYDDDELDPEEAAY